jgi:hypothetical protein
MPNGVRASEQQPTPDGQEQTKSVWAGPHRMATGTLGDEPRPRAILPSSGKFPQTLREREREREQGRVGITTQQITTRRSQQQPHTLPGQFQEPAICPMRGVPPQLGRTTRALVSARPTPKPLPALTPAHNTVGPGRPARHRGRPNLSLAAQFSSHAHTTYRASDHSPCDAPLCAKPVKAGAQD